MRVYCGTLLNLIEYWCIRTFTCSSLISQRQCKYTIPSSSALYTLYNNSTAASVTFMVACICIRSFFVSIITHKFYTIRHQQSGLGVKSMITYSVCLSAIIAVLIESIVLNRQESQ